jgi:hypothetical protein
MHYRVLQSTLCRELTIRLGPMAERLLNGATKGYKGTVQPDRSSAKRIGIHAKLEQLGIWSLACLGLSWSSITRTAVVYRGRSIAYS